MQREGVAGVTALRTSHRQIPCCNTFPIYVCIYVGYRYSFLLFLSALYRINLIQVAILLVILNCIRIKVKSLQRWTTTTSSRQSCLSFIQKLGMNLGFSAQCLSQFSYREKAHLSILLIKLILHFSLVLVTYIVGSDQKMLDFYLLSIETIVQSHSSRQPQSSVES